MTGVDGYTFTGRILAWGAERAAAGGLQGTGALGPADGFGLEALVEGCRQAGISEDAPDRRTGPPRSTPPPAERPVQPVPRPGRAAPAARARGRGERSPWRWRVAVGSGSDDALRPDERPRAGPRPRSSRRTPSPCAGRSASCSCRASTARRVPAYMRRRLRAGETAGVILFGGNGGHRGRVARAHRRACSARRGGSALVAVDQEGGEIRTAAVRRPRAGPAGAGEPGPRARARPRRGRRAARRSA